MQRLRPKDIKTYREQAVKEQDYKCALCKQELALEDAVLDHAHSSGYIRAALHRFCNTYLGAIENNIKRNKITDVQLSNILANAQSYMQTATDILHPTYRTPEERKARAKARAKKKRISKRSNE